jgi:hypothetical protein
MYLSNLGLRGSIPAELGELRCAFRMNTMCASAHAALPWRGSVCPCRGSYLQGALGGAVPASVGKLTNIRELCATCTISTHTYTHAQRKHRRGTHACSKITKCACMRYRTHAYEQHKHITHARTHARTRTHTHTHARAHTHTRTHAHTHTRARARYDRVAFAQDCGLYEYRRTAERGRLAGADSAVSAPLRRPLRAAACPLLNVL